MRQGMLVVAMVALLAGGCELVTAPAVSGGPGCRKLVRQDAADYLNFVKLNEITYTADGPAVGRTLGDGDLGPVHARVRCSLREKMDPTGGEPEGKVRRISVNRRADGTATVRAYDATDRRVQRGILVPRRFGELVEAAAS